MTCFNEVGRVRDSLSSLLAQLNNDYEVVVVDNFSTDGTYEILREFEQSHKVNLVQRRGSRGVGRQAAFENASGEFILANLDLDDIFLPVLSKVVTLYHEKAEGKLLAIFNSSKPPDATTGWVQAMTMGPRGLIASLGGWRDLNLFEDWDIWSRASRVQKYGWATFRFAENESVHPELKRGITRLVQRHLRYRDRLLLGIRIFDKGERISLTQRLAYVTARLSLIPHGVLVGQDPEFKPLNPSLFVDFAAGQTPARQKEAEVPII